MIAVVGLSFLYFTQEDESQNDITGAVVSEPWHSYTKAICNESNFCQDHEIICSGNKTLSIKPITGATIQHLPKWKDPREKETIEKTC